MVYSYDQSFSATKEGSCICLSVGPYMIGWDMERSMAGEVETACTYKPPPKEWFGHHELYEK